MASKLGFHGKSNIHTTLLDPSEKLRPEAVYAGKLENQFRNYSEDPTDPIKERVRTTYYNMHTNQTVDFVRSFLSNLNIHHHVI
ncbi:GSCOCG00006770001-RA-CDS [Cotesia congregata]|nr:GSCOCG00006770001-RA-CDS [Cotesia congregata]